MRDFRDIIRQAKADKGSQAKLAAVLGVSQQQVWYLLHEAKRPSADMALKIEAALGVPRSDLRPDLWPAPVQSEGAAAA